jgi:uncharacterized protein YjbI with pentapeptide repeats
MAALALCLGGSVAHAQNASQIARVQGGADCQGCNLFQADLGGKTLKGHRYSRARLRQADLSLGTFNGARFDHTDLRDANLYGVLAGHADFTGADLTNATLVGGYFQAARFSGAKLDGANLGGADLRRAAGLTQAQLSRACADASTQLPPGLHAPACK